MFCKSSLPLAPDPRPAPSRATTDISAGSSMPDYSSHSSFSTAAALLNASQTEAAPFDFCPVFGPNDTIAERRGQWGLLRSRLHTGSGARIQRVVQKALAGEATTISILGGSGTFFTSFFLRPYRGAALGEIATRCRCTVKRNDPGV